MIQQCHAVNNNVIYCSFYERSATASALYKYLIMHCAILLKLWSGNSVPLKKVARQNGKTAKMDNTHKFFFCYENKTQQRTPSSTVSLPKAFPPTTNILSPGRTTTRLSYRAVGLLPIASQEPLVILYW